MGLRPCPLEHCSLRSQRRICWERYMKITAAKPSEARSSAKSGTKNLKLSNPKGSLLPLCQGYEGHGASASGVWREFCPPYKFWAKSVQVFSNAHRQLENAAFCTITRQHSSVGLRFLKTAKEPKKYRL